MQRVGHGITRTCPLRAVSNPLPLIHTLPALVLSALLQSQPQLPVVRVLALERVMETLWELGRWVHVHRLFIA